MNSRTNKIAQRPFSGISVEGNTPAVKYFYFALILLVLSIFFLVCDSTFKAQGTSSTALPLTVTPASLDFGGTGAGTETPPQIVTLTNVATYKFPVKVAVTGPFLITSDTCGNLLNGGASCQITLVFSPVTPGNFSGTLSILPAVPSPTVSLRGTAPIPTEVPYSWTINVSDLPDVQPLPPGTPAAPADLEGSESTTTASGGSTSTASKSLLPSPNIMSATGSNSLTLLVSPSFEGMSYVGQGTFVSPAPCIAQNTYCGSAPPDTQIGVSKRYVVEAVNNGYVVFDKAGKNIVGPKSLFDLFNVPIMQKISDPMIRYDPTSGHWFISLMNWTNPDNGGDILLAVSDTSDPAGSYTGYKMEMPTLPDDPRMAVGADKVVLTDNAYTYKNGESKGGATEFWVLNKSQLDALAPTVKAVHCAPDQGGFKINPAQPYSSGSELYMVAVPSSAISPLSGAVGTAFGLTVWAISGVPGVSNVAFNKKPVPLVDPLVPALPATQKDTSDRIPTGGGRDDGLLDAYFRDGNLWASANGRCSSVDETTCAWFFHIQSITPSLLNMKETDFKVGGSGSNNYYYPAIRPGSKGDLVAVFSGSSSAHYPSVYAGVSLSPNFGSLQQVTLLHKGDSAYTQLGSDGKYIDRWGDYSGAAVDPANGAVWVAGEYATQDHLSYSMWGTWISQVVPSVSSPGASSPVYVANSGSNSVSVINTATNTAATIPGVNQPGAGPSGIAVTPDGSRVYVSNYHSSGTNAGTPGSVSVINTTTNSVEAIPVGFLTDGVAITPDGTRAYVSNECASSACSLGSPGSVSVINTATNTVETTIPVGSSPFGIAVTPDGTRVYVANECGSPGTCSSGSISVISTVSNTVTATIPLSLQPFGIAITPDGARAYVTYYNSGSVSVINLVTNTVSAPLPVGSQPAGVAITPDGTRAYVANFGSNSVYVINTATNTVVAPPIPVGSHPVGVATTADGTRAYVANWGSGTVSVVDTASNTVVNTIQVGSAPQGVAARSLP